MLNKYLNSAVTLKHFSFTASFMASEFLALLPGLLGEAVFVIIAVLFFFFKPSFNIQALKPLMRVSMSNQALRVVLSTLFTVYDAPPPPPRLCIPVSSEIRISIRFVAHYRSFRR